MRRLWPLLILVALAGCKSQRQLDLMGLWSGEFVSDASRTPTKPFKGFLRLFGNSKYQLHLENNAQGFDVLGTWRIDRHRLDMSVSNIQFQNPSELNQQTLNLKVIPINSIQSAYGRRFILELNPSGSTLVGLRIGLGPLVGQQVFQKRRLDQE